MVHAALDHGRTMSGNSVYNIPRSFQETPQRVRHHLLVKRHLLLALVSGRGRLGSYRNVVRAATSRLFRRHLG